jgi:effector-binding domain-containing protein
MTSRDHLIGQVRFMTARAERLFCVTTQAPRATLDDELGRLMPLLEAAQAAAGIATAGPVVVRYFATGQEQLWQMDVGVPVTAWDWVLPAGQAQIVTLPALRCAALLYWGSLAHIGEAYDALNRGVAQAGLAHQGEGREWYLRFAGDASDETVILLQLELNPALPPALAPEQRCEMV